MLTSFLGKTRLLSSDKSGEQMEKKNLCRSTHLKQQVYTEASCLQSSYHLPLGQHADGLFEMFVTVTVLHWTVLGCDVLFISKAGLPCYACFATELNSHWLQTDATLRRCSVLCRVKFWKVKSTIHVYLYSTNCGKIWGSSATPILKNILYM